MTVIDLQASKKTIESAQTIVQSIIAALGAITFFLVFYFMRVSATSAISERVREYGQMRAIGLRKEQGVKIYIYEEFAVLISAVLLGMVGGLILSSVSTA